MKKISLGCDHAAVELKNDIISHLAERGFDTEDVGTYTTDSCDYPLIAAKLCRKVLDEGGLGILVCGTGIGMSIAANKHRGIRAAVCSDTFSARLTRIHNDANVLCLGARVIGKGLACDLVDAFVDAEFEGGKHARRVNMLTDIENGQLA